MNALWQHRAGLLRCRLELVPQETSRPSTRQRALADTPALMLSQSANCAPPAAGNEAEPALLQDWFGERCRSPKI